MIEARGMMKVLGGRAVLSDVDLTVESGSTTFLLGKSGAGKSVLLQCLLGLLPIDGGTIVLDGVDATQLSENKWLGLRRRCGVLFQFPALFDFLTVEENIRFGGTHEGPAIDELLDRVHLSPTVKSLRPYELSLSAQKRVALARALFSNPSVLFFDEPTTGLDPMARAAILVLIQELSERDGTASLVVSHDIEAALSLGDRLLFLDEGKIQASVTPQQARQSEVALVREFVHEAIG